MSEMSNSEVHDNIMRRLQLIERKVSLQGIQLGQVADILNRICNKNANADYFKELTANASSVVQSRETNKPV